GVAERRTEPVENGRPREELPDVARLAAEHLLGEEVDDEPVVASELADEGARRGVTAQRERREVQSGRPSFGAFEENRQVGLAELNAGDRVHKRRRVRG